MNYSSRHFKGADGLVKTGKSVQQSPLAHPSCSVPFHRGCVPRQLRRTESNPPPGPTLPPRPTPIDRLRPPFEEEGQRRRPRTAAAANGAAGGEAGDAAAADAVQAHRQPPQEPGRRPPQVPRLHHQHRAGSVLFAFCYLLLRAGTLQDEAVK